MTTSTNYEKMTCEQIGYRLGAFAGNQELPDSSSIDTLNYINCRRLQRISSEDQSAAATHCQYLTNIFLQMKLSDLQERAKKLSTVPITPGHKIFQKLISDASALDAAAEQQRLNAYTSFGNGFDALNAELRKTRDLAQQSSAFIRLLKGE